MPLGGGQVKIHHIIMVLLEKKEKNVVVSAFDAAYMNSKYWFRY